MKGLRERYESHHGVTFTDDALKLAAELSAKYIHDRHLPDKAIDVLDEAGARARIARGSVIPSRADGEESRADGRSAHGSGGSLAPLGTTPTTIGEDDVEYVVARMAKIPPRTIAVSEKARLQNLEADLRKVIYGQDHAIAQIVNAIKVARSGLGHPEKPVGSFLFSGPTGVGKTELAKQLAIPGVDSNPIFAGFPVISIQGYTGIGEYTYSPLIFYNELKQWKDTAGKK